MIKLKNEIDIRYIKKAKKIGEEILKKISKYIKPGTTSKQLDKKIEMLVRLKGAKPSFKGYKGFPTATCISINEDIIHGVPDDEILREGDIVKIDLGINYKGYYSDQAKTYFVGESLVFDHFRLVYATKTALDGAIKVAIAGNTIGDISAVIEEIARNYGFGILEDYAGHGVGFAVHEDPIVPNRVGKNKDTVLQKGMVLAIEPMFVLGQGKYIKREGGAIEADGLSSHWERTIIIE